MVAWSLIQPQPGPMRLYRIARVVRGDASALETRSPPALAG